MDIEEWPVLLRLILTEAGNPFACVRDTNAVAPGCGPQRLHWLSTRSSDARDSEFGAHQHTEAECGSGPSMFALSNNSLIAEQAAEAMQAVFTKQGIESDVYVSLINRDGAVVC